MKMTLRVFDIARLLNHVCFQQLTEEQMIAQYVEEEHAGDAGASAETISSELVSLCCLLE